MAKMTSTIVNSGTVGGVKRTLSQKVTKQVKQVHDNEVTYDRGSATHYEPYLIQTIDPAVKGATTDDDWKQMSIYNSGDSVAEVFFTCNSYFDNSGAHAQVTVDGGDESIVRPHISWLLRPGEYLALPNPRAVIFNSEQNAGTPKSAATGTLINEPGNLGPTDGKGYITSSDYFGNADTGGLAPGSFWARFYMAGYQELGMTNAFNKKPRQTAASSTGLTANTAYEFRITVDGGTIRQVAFTTHTSNVSWGGTNGVLSKINAALLALFNAGSITSLARMYITSEGDIRVTSGSRLNTSAIALAVGATGTAEFFGTGNVPPVGSSDGSDGINTAVAAALETPALLGLDPNSTSHFLKDNGSGVLSRGLGGGGTINYDESGAIEFKNCPPNASFRVGFFYNSAHSGENYYTASLLNTVYKVWCRSTNYNIPCKLRILTFV